MDTGILFEEYVSHFLFTVTDIIRKSGK